MNSDTENRMIGKTSTPVSMLNMHRALDQNQITLVHVVSLAPVTTAACYINGMTFLLNSIVAMFVVLAWHLLFSRLRNRDFTWYGIATALVFSILIPANFPVWQQALVLSLGTVMAQEIFGGRGRNFLNPVVVAMAFAYFSFPDQIQSHTEIAISLATLPGGILLMAGGLISWRICVAFGIGVFIAIAANGSSHLADPMILASLSFGLVFLICDPVSAASTNAGRWIYGLLSGGLVVLFGTNGDIAKAMVFAALLASLFAPLIDHGIVVLNIRRRRLRNE